LTLLGSIKKSSISPFFEMQYTRLRRLTNLKIPSILWESTGLTWRSNLRR